jgi:hypothetical protein
MTEAEESLECDAEVLEHQKLFPNFLSAARTIIRVGW